MTESNLLTVHEAVRLFSESDMDGLAELYAQDAVLTGPEGWPEVGPFNGREAVVGQFARMREDWTKHRMTIQRETTEGDWVLVGLRWTAEGIASGAPLDMNFAGAYRIASGEIAEAHFSWTWEEAVATAGLGAQ